MDASSATPNSQFAAARGRRRPADDEPCSDGSVRPARRRRHLLDAAFRLSIAGLADPFSSTFAVEHSSDGIQFGGGSAAALSGDIPAVVPLPPFDAPAQAEVRRREIRLGKRPVDSVLSDFDISADAAPPGILYFLLLLLTISKTNPLALSPRSGTVGRNSNYSSWI